MGSDLLGSLGRIKSLVVEEEGVFALVRFEDKGAAYLVEALGKAGGLPRVPVWPTIGGVIRHVKEHRPDADTRLLFFKDPGGELLIERIRRRPFSEDQARQLGLSVSTVVRGLHSRGVTLGYIGPESVCLAPDGSVSILAGGRGVPSGPFSAPESLASPSSDPRSDVFAIGALMFRAVAGSDDREAQIRCWDSLSAPFKALLEKMVAQRPEDRHPNIPALVEDLRSGCPPPPVNPGGRPARESPAAGGAGPVRPGGRRRGRIPVPFVIIAVLALAAAAFIIFSPDGGEAGGEGQAQRPDTLPVPVPDTLPPADTLAVGPPSAYAGPGETIVWVSNCTGIAGSAASFRSGAARDFASVYPSSGSGRRDSSVLLLRNTTPGAPPDSQRHWQSALLLASSDSTMEIVPVDVTVVLGTDLSYSGLNSGIFTEPAAPADTILVDVVNQGLQYLLDGQGPASWFAHALDGKSVTLGGSEHLVRVVDVRDGDREPNEELGMDPTAATTFFLYRQDVSILPEFEGAVRSAFQALPAEVAGPPEGIPLPDIWVILGKPAD